MKIFSKMIVNIVCVAILLDATPPASRSACADERPPATVISNHPAPYRPPLRQAEVLFVEDPGNGAFGPATKPDLIWEGVLVDLFGAGGYGWYGPCSTMSKDGPSLDTMQQYELVIWNTYDYWWPDTAALTVNDQNNIGDYLEGGGKVWLIGQDLLYSGVPMSWMLDYFHLSNAYQDYDSLADSISLYGHVEINGISVITVTDYQHNPFYPDELVPDAQAHTVLEDADSSKSVGIFYPGTSDWMSAFWTVDGRTTDSWDDWIQMVTGMFDAFGIHYGIAEEISQSKGLRLSMNIRPHPIVTATEIYYDIPFTGYVRLQIFDKIGQLVITLVDHYKNAGSYVAAWNSKDIRGRNVANGVYFARLTCGETSTSAHLVVIR